MMHQINSVAPASRQPPFTRFAVPGVAEDCLDEVGMPLERARDQVIFSDGQPAANFYKVVSGAIRTFKILEDGRRQIVGFYLPGDFVGLEVGEHYTVSAEAVSATELVSIRLGALLERAERNERLFQKLWKITRTELSRSQSHALLLIKSAQERVQDFLIDFAERASSREVIELPMSRQDIADYLGLTIETVSRTLTSLERTGLISLSSTRRILLKNFSALKAAQY